MAETVKILFVDDEPAIRLSLPAILRLHGFEVASAGTVSEAIQAISAQRFDVLISDLNIGSPGDGFTVVSAMRRTQPSCVTLILTGFPAFETALQAIRSQVDDYLIKPAGVDKLVAAIEEKLQKREPYHLQKLKRFPQLLIENMNEIVTEILRAEQKILHAPRVHLTEEECRGNAESIIQGLAAQLASGSLGLLPELADLSRLHGQARHRQGYSASMLVEENRIFSAAILDCVQNNLLIADVSHLVSDLKLLTDTLAAMLREAIAELTTTARAA